MTSDFLLLKEIIEKNGSFLLTTHVNPDPDAIGSTITLFYILKKLGKTVRVVNCSETPYFIGFMDEENIAEKFDPDIHASLFEELDVLIALDFNHIGRMSKMQDYFINSSKLKICIDHHSEPESEYFDYLFDYPDLAATSHLIYNFIKETNICQLDYKMAYLLYIAINSDTGSFNYERTTSEIHRIAADLIDCGVDPFEVHHKINSENRINKILLMGNVLSNIKVDETGRVAYIVIPTNLLRSLDAYENEVDNLVNYCLSIKGVEVGLMFMEMKDGAKINFRSKGKVAVNKLAAEFSGGGHHNAAGARLFDINFDEELITKVVTKANEYLNEIEKGNNDFFECSISNIKRI